MESGIETSDRKRKRMIMIAFIVFVVGLVLFTLFSNTLQSLTLPKVSTEKPARGSLVHTYEGGGVLKPVAEARLTNSSGWKVQKILVKEGDRVKKGQKLIQYDSKAAERELQDELSNLDKQNIELQRLQDQFIQSATEGDEFKIRAAKRDIEAHKLDQTVQERKINGLKEQLNSQKELTAPFNGVITKVSAIKGMAGGGEPDVVISNSTLGYQFDISLDGPLLSILGLSIGEKLEVEISTAQEPKPRMSQGTITEMRSAEPRAQSQADAGTDSTLTIPQKILSIKVVDSSLQGGEQALIKLEKKSSKEGFKVSPGAIRKEREGMYMFKVEEQVGALGNVFVARKVRLTSVETNGRETMVQSEGLYDDDKIILESSEPLQDGNRIRLE
ncbi:HlyD family efflux transporter periplasmic adaptor subunit [Paenibacillus sp. J22TS3]|uniref:HlyD family efflux transporter periplasmic adaptor subunit n=1 Tax=Paenibacillus sp. J22TS3 TaxID=2807192 RepID=UPI001B2D10A9|nr:HlyD family efflux transporter periplasmic adaptor subunit [Paenibacillus sp. J22TS3]GIP19980.1 putative efflux system component YknX [Paenibacillus sp. J22TS3]